MKKDNKTNGMPRRSFMKKSVVAAVAASNMTIFSGLVNAGEGPLDVFKYPDCKYCDIEKVPVDMTFAVPCVEINGRCERVQNAPQQYECQADQSCSLDLECGETYVYTDEAMGCVVADANGIPIRVPVKFNCKDRSTYTCI
jgi:hypothetical protein